MGKKDSAARQSVDCEPDHLIWGVNAVTEALREPSHRVTAVRVEKGRGGERLQHLINLARERGVAVDFVNCGCLGVTRGISHQGVAALLGPVPCLTFDALLADLEESKGASILALDALQDPRNVGSILRSALAAGFRHVLMTRKRSVPLTGTVARTSAGALAHLKISQVTNMSNALAALKEAGYWIYGAVVEPEAEPVYTADFGGRVCLVLGGEAKGIRPLVRRQCDHLITIPMQATFNSLNVAVAAGILMFEINRRRH